MKKKEKLLRAIGDVDERFIEEADPTRKATHPRKVLKFSILAACICLICASIGLTVFFSRRNDPATELKEYKDSPYYELIEKLYPLVTNPRGSNSFTVTAQNVLSLLYGGSKGEDMDVLESNAASEDSLESVVDGDASTGTGQYKEVTDNQVAGVIEGDLLKRTDTRAYYLSQNILKIYSIEGEDSRLLGSYEILPFFGTAGYYYYNRGELFLSENGETVTLICPYQINGRGAQVGLLSLDVKDPEKITQKAILSLSGRYLSARSLNGELLLMSEFEVMRSADFSDESTFIPQIKTEGSESCIPLENILCPETLTNTRYTVICSLDQESLALKDCTALLSYSREIYVSSDSVYATRPYTEESNGENGVILSKSMTEITRLYFGNGTFVCCGSVSVAGSLKDQYSMDEYENMLRVVSTTETFSTKEKSGQDGIVSLVNLGAAEPTNASLYIISLETMTVSHSVERFAPDGETVQSVRFDGPTAYVCTSVQLSDPVFFFDLSDPANISVKDTGTIAGFSSSLINFGEGILLGIGHGNSFNTVKIEVYRENAEKVISVDTYTVEHASYSTEYKSYLIDREHQLIGLAVNVYGASENRNRYLLLSFDGYRLNELCAMDMEVSDLETIRAFIQDGILYVFHTNGLTVKPIQ